MSATFVRDAALRARDEHSACIPVHNHGGTTTVAFSPTDLASHERGYPALCQLTGTPVCALVLTEQAAAGDFWLPDGTRSHLAEVIVPGNNLLRLRPRSASSGAPITGGRYARQELLFGEVGQQAFHGTKVAIVGLGGAGTLLTEGLAGLGAGHLVLIDDDTVEERGLVHDRVTSELACPVGRVGRMSLCPSLIRKSSARMSSGSRGIAARG
jgi:hypothetical protein